MDQTLTVEEELHELGMEAYAVRGLEPDILVGESKLGKDGAVLCGQQGSAMWEMRNGWWYDVWWEMRE